MDLVVGCWIQKLGSMDRSFVCFSLLFVYLDIMREKLELGEGDLLFDLSAECVKYFVAL